MSLVEIRGRDGKHIDSIHVEALALPDVVIWKGRFFLRKEAATPFETPRYYEVSGVHHVDEIVGESRRDMYRHLNDEGDGVVVGIEEIASQVDELNYGTHRLLSAIVRVRQGKRPGNQLALQLAQLLDRGLY